MRDKQTGLVQEVDCPRCGWTNRTVDSGMVGLHHIDRLCSNRKCRSAYIAVFRGVEFVGVAAIESKTADGLLEALEGVGGLTPHERRHLLSSTAARAEAMRGAS